MRTTRLAVLAATAASMGLAGCANPKTQASMAQALNDAASEMSTLRTDMSQLQSDMDSLRTVVAKQDSLLSRIAAVNGIPR